MDPIKFQDDDDRWRFALVVSKAGQVISSTLDEGRAKLFPNEVHGQHAAYIRSKKERAEAARLKANFETGSLEKRRFAA